MLFPMEFYITCIFPCRTQQTKCQGMPGAQEVAVSVPGGTGGGSGEGCSCFAYGTGARRYITYHATSNQFIYSHLYCS